MFENTLLIIKPDYTHKRKSLLLHLIKKGFLTQAQRKCAFTPEDAAEFYKGKAEENDFMLNVIMLSKGVSEVFILTKEQAVADLFNTMVCFFNTSTEMERNVHVTRNEADVRAEITFIFPNYIHEPIPILKPHTFCANPLVEPLVNQLYEIVQQKPDETQSWKRKLAEWLTMSNPVLPSITNQCSHKPSLLTEEKGQQVNIVGGVDGGSGAAARLRSDAMKAARRYTREADSSLDDTDSTLAAMSSSSCITCADFDASDVCSAAVSQKDSITKIAEMFEPKIIPLLREEQQSEMSLEDCEECTCRGT